MEFYDGFGLTMRGSMTPYDEGFESYFRNKGRYRNPYPLNTQFFNDFERGWTQALKRSAVYPDLQADYQYRYGGDEPDPYKPPVEPYKPNHNAYAAAKGKGRLK